MPLPRVNFSNVNITIQQFQEIASGKYNAGEVRLATATLKIVKSAKMAVGTKDVNVKTHFGSVVVEEEVTVDLTAEVPTVTNVRVAQRFDDSFDLQERYLLETEPVPAPQAPAPQL